MIEIKVNENIYKKKFNRIEWSGGIYGSSRKLNVDFQTTENINVNVGDSVEFKLDNTETLFKGRIFTVEKNTDNKNVNFIAYDNSIYLNKNFFVKNYFNRVPSEIVKEICGELGLEVGRLQKIKLNVPFQL